MYKRENTAALARSAIIRLCAASLCLSAFAGSALAAPATVTAQDGLRLRTGASTSAQTIATLPSGSSAEVLEALDGWYRVDASGKTGYVSSRYLAVTGTVSASSLNVRSTPSTSGSRITTLSAGTQITLLESLDGWYRIELNGKTGYVSSQYVTLSQLQPSTAGSQSEPQPEVQTDAQPTQNTQSEKTCGIVSASSLNVRSGPGASYEKLGSLSSGAQVEILETLDGWHRIEAGYVSADYVLISDGSISTLQAQVAAYARNFLGCAYVYGGNGPTVFDCSGLTKYIYNHFGYTINRTATQQLKNGIPVSKENLQPGDLVFFNSAGTGIDKATHVGVYIGNGEFLHASNKKVGVTITSLSDPYRLRTYTTARRIL